MADNADGVEVKLVDPAADDAIITKTQTKTIPPVDPVTTQTTQKASCKKHTDGKDKKTVTKKSKPKKRSKKVERSDSESSDSDDSSSESDESDEEIESDETSSSSEDSERAKRKAKKSKTKAKKSKLKRSKKQSKNKKKAAHDEDSSDEEADITKTQATNLKNAVLLKAALKRRAKEVDSDGLELEDTHEDPHDAMKELMARLRIPNRGGAPRGRGGRGRGGWNTSRGGLGGLEDDARILAEAKKLAKAKEKHKRASKVAFKRVDQLWDQSIHNYKLTETVDDPDQDEWDQYIFTVRRKFDWEHKYQETFVDIKSKPLKDCLQHVMKDVKGVSLVQDTPHIDPNMLFLYLEECRAYIEELKKLSKNEKEKKARKTLKTRTNHLKILVKYLDKDYADTKKTLYPMLENNTITFDLLWALYKPNTIAYCSTYGDTDQPRAFKIDFATKESHFMKGTWYSIEGKYLEYDGKAFGMGAMHTDVTSFQGARKISSLDCFPLQYHRDAVNLRAKLIERGKKFVALKGMNYRCHTGMAYTKRKRQILKININGRVMVDPAIHRRINPNYPISTVKPKEENEYPDPDESEESCGCENSSDDDADGDQNTPSSSEENRRPRKKFKIVKDENGRHHLVDIESGDEAEDEEDVEKEKLDGRKDEIEETFNDEELLIASPVVLGFAFSEKLWLEFTVSGISDIVWNAGAFDSLVLPENQKSIVKALVSSHAFHPSRSIDDIISGKGKGLVAVLHGPPGTGKTLTAEGIADLLKCPLYMVSAGDLGTDPRTLEKELQNILDIAHSWGALLLLDEADVFLEKRSIHDIHRNALVSIFLRLLEYFQGILFLTTNRVETFDEAFVSRIHLSLRYSELTSKARRTVWKMFIQRVRDSEDMEVEDITEEDFNTLAKRNINGRQIKNLTRAAQALAVYENKPMSMEHIKRVLDVAESFITDLKGGEGYIEAMRGMYFV
jgi:hypothetical protein